MSTSDEVMMERAIGLAADVRSITSPNPWVGAVVLTADGAALDGATLYSTLEPCSHHGRTPPCTDAIIAAGVGRVVVGIEDPDALVAGEGLAKLRAAGIAIDVGVCANEVRAQLAPYVK